MRVRKAVVPAAGKGTRLLPVTRSVAKELLPIVTTPAIDFIVDEIAQSGLSEIVLVTSPLKPDVERHLRTHPAGLRVTTVIQEQPLGLGHAIGCAAQAVGDEPFVVLLPDDIFEPPWPTADLLQLYSKVGSPVVSLLEVAPDAVSSYGIVSIAWERDGAVGIADLVEKPARDQAPSQLALPGRYLLEPDIFGEIARTKAGARDEIQLTDALRAIASCGRLVGQRVTGPHYDVGTPAGLIDAIVVRAARDPVIAALLRQRLRDVFSDEARPR